LTKSRPVRKYKYRLKFVPSALKEWEGLDGSVKEPIRNALRKRLDNPHVPSAALHGDLAGHYKIKLQKQGYRLVYGVEEDALVVMVMAIGKRDDGAVYASTLQRLLASARAAVKVATERAAAAGLRKPTSQKPKR